MRTNYTAAGLHNIFAARNTVRKRASSFDRTGGNFDYVLIEPGATYVMAEIDRPGVITHIWMTMVTGQENGVEEKFGPRKVALRFYWDGETNPSVQAPIGDFFGMGHGITKNFVSEPLQMSPENGNGFNSWWPMPFNKARLTVTNECRTVLRLYFYFDYDETDEHDENTLRFHAAWHRECPTKGKSEKCFPTHRDWCFTGENVNGEGNYLIMQAKGRGHYCGCNLNIHNLEKSGLWNWPGEGDDMIFIDGDKLPTLNGTGTEDYVNMAWCPQQEYNAPYHGLILGGKDNWTGRITYYRYHIKDAIPFKKDIKVTIEHGHANNRSDDWSSTAYWYQNEPHTEFYSLPIAEERLPIDEHHYRVYGELKFLK